MLTGALAEKTTPHEWFDDWSPSQVMRECGCGFLLDFENVRAVGHTPGDDPDSLVFVGRSGAEDVPGLLDNGRAILADLWRACRSHLAVMGNHHWGIVIDSVMLSESLNLGLMLSNKAQQRNAQEARWMVGLNLDRADFPY